MNETKMGKKIKLIWDFRGNEAEAIASHHAKHLSEYKSINQITEVVTGHENLTSMHSIAYLITEENQMPELRDALKPQRGEYVSQED